MRAVIRIASTVCGVFLLELLPGARPAAAQPVQGTGAPGQVAVWTSQSTIGGDALLMWSLAQHRLGIGTANPLEQLHLTGNLRLPVTTGADAGVIKLGNFPFLHGYGGYNTFVGREVGNFTMTGSGNTAIGNHNLQSNTTGNDNTAIGRSSLASNSAGGWNTAIGVGSLYSNTSGLHNTAVGCNSLYDNTTSWDNTATGFNSLHFNTTGTRNTATGAFSLTTNSEGKYNTANGHMSMYGNTTGTDNTAIGHASLTSNTTGSWNIALGRSAGYYLTTGSYNIDIGNPGVAGETHTIRIGESYQSRTFIAGIRSRTTGSHDAIPVLIDSAGQLGTVSSSRRFKQDVRDMGETSSRLLALRPVSFRYVGQSEGIHFGLIAEEVAEVLPELVVHDATGQMEAVAYHELPAMLLNELQKHQATIQAQQAEIEALKVRLAEQGRQLQVLLEEHSARKGGAAAGR